MQVTSLLSQQDNSPAPEQAAQAAILHNAGSLLVVFNSARLVRTGEHLEPFTRSAVGEPAVTACAPCAPPSLVSQSA